MLKLFFLFLYCSGILLAINLNPSMPDNNNKLVWSDEFNGNELDGTKWNYRYLGKRKLGYNTEDSIKVSNGTLKIVAYKEGSRYCSGMISTQDRFEPKYGYYEMRAKIPKAIGLQTEFWIQSPLYGKIIGNPANAGSEIDIMEYIKKRPGEVHFSNHWDGYGIFHKKDIASVPYPQIEDGNWHTFGLLWSKDSYKYYLDGKLMHQKTKAISQINEYIILSLEISDWAGASDITDKDLPDQFEIDYVKVYQKNSIEQNTVKKNNIKIIR